MIYKCTANTSLLDLIGRQCSDGQRLVFRCGPLVQAKKRGEELVLENSAALSALMLAKIRSMQGKMIIDGSSEAVCPRAGFSLTLR